MDSWSDSTSPRGLHESEAHGSVGSVKVTAYFDNLHFDMLFKQLGP